MMLSLSPDLPDDIELVKIEYDEGEKIYKLKCASGFSGKSNGFTATFYQKPTNIVKEAAEDAREKAKEIQADEILKKLQIDGVEGDEGEIL